MADFKAYIDTFPLNTQTLLWQLDSIIRQACPDATTDFKYGMPTFVLEGINLVHYAGYAHHIGFYPTPSAIEQFENELKPYQRSKGAVQFPLDHPLPTDLIHRMVLARVKENHELAAARKAKKRSK